MFESIGKFVYRFKFLVVGVLVTVMLALTIFWRFTNTDARLSKSGWFDTASSSSVAAAFLDSKDGRDHLGDVVVMVTAPKGEKVDDPAFLTTVAKGIQNTMNKSEGNITSAVGFTDIFYGSVLPTAGLTGQQATDNENQRLTNAAQSYLKSSPKERDELMNQAQNTMDVVSKDGNVGIISYSLKGNSDDSVGDSYTKVKNDFAIPGVETQVAGVAPLTYGIFDQIGHDVERAGLIGVPLVALLLFLVFGGLVAMTLPLIVGGLTIGGGFGLISMISYYMPISTFAMSIIELIGLGIATDYGLFIVSRFREELAEGYSTSNAVRRSLMSAGRTVTMSAALIIVALLTMLIFPEEFLQSCAIGAILAVGLAVGLSITLLPAILGILGPRVDMLGLKALRKTKTKTEVEKGFWGKSLRFVLKRPLLITIPVIAILAFMMLPLNNISFGGLSSKYLPTSNPTRAAQDKFDKLFPTQRAFPVKVLTFYGNQDQNDQIVSQLDQIPGFSQKWHTVAHTENTSKMGIQVYEANLINDNDTKQALSYIRTLKTPVPIMITGFNVLAEDSIAGVFKRMPIMIGMLVTFTAIIMFLSFGSVVLPIKAVLMSGLTLLATMGVLTWIFTEGHFAGILNFTAGPLMSVVLVIIIAIVFGLSTDYEIFLLSRMIEAKERGMSTGDAIVSGTAQTGRIITAAATILIVVAGAFAFSELVLMKYIAFGLIMALLMDATIVRMLFVPAIMKLLGEDCWWAPKWMRRLQEKAGFGETSLPDEIGNRVKTATGSFPAVGHASPQKINPTKF